MWIVKIYKDYGDYIINHDKTFKDEDDAYEYFENEIYEEFDYELEQGLISNQELQNIINNNIYRYENSRKEILISIEELDDKEN